MKVAFFTGHMAGMPRKANVMLLADAYHKAGWEVRIVTGGYSLKSIFKGDHRKSYASTCPLNRWFSVDTRMKGYLQSPWRNPISYVGKLKLISPSLFYFYATRLPKAVLSELQDVDVIFIESGEGTIYSACVKKYFPKAKLVYQASDPLSTLGAHPVIMHAEKKYLPIFDLIICTAQIRAKEFDSKKFCYIPQAMDTALFDAPVDNPYPSKHNIVSVGDMLFDAQAVVALAKACPDWTIHLFGAKACCPEALPNIITHGEAQLQKTIPYVVHADIGLAPYRPAPNVEYLSQSSLKMKQYSYARLPIIAPDFATANCAHAIPYNPHDLSSIKAAFEKASRYDRSTISREGILSWDQVLQQIMESLMKVPL